MKKKILITLCTMLMLSMLVACGNKTETSDTSVSTSTDAASENVSEEINPDVDEYGNNIKDQPYIPENSDFIYSNEDMTEIIGLTDQGLNSMDIIFPEYVEKISDVSFSGSTTIKTVYFMNENVELENVSFSCESLETVKNLPIKMDAIYPNMFYGCRKLRTIGSVENVITLPENITIIGEGAFSGCIRITDIDLSHIIVIDSRAFECCSSLINAIWSNKLEAIRDAAFVSCGFEVVTLPESVMTVGENAFTNNKNLTTVDIPGQTTVDESAFTDCPNLTGEYSNKANMKTESDKSDEKDAIEE